jgi:hypothetical protein
MRKERQRYKYCIRDRGERQSRNSEIERAERKNI